MHIRRYGHCFIKSCTAAIIAGASFIPVTVQAQAMDLEGSSAPQNPEFLKFFAEQEQARSMRMAVIPQTTEEGYFLGRIPSPVKLPAPTAPRPIAALAMALPTKFDLRTSVPVGVTSIRNQYACGSCWTFGALATLESNLKYKHATIADFSEADLNENHGFDTPVCSGGNWWMTTAYLARWGGPVNEADAPYPAWFEAGEGSTGPTDHALASATPGVATKYHVQNVNFYSQSAQPMTATERAAIKQAIVDYGAMDIAIYWNSTYYNSTYKAFYCNAVGTGTNHEVAIVGWDDAYSRTKFKTAPAGNGAFIVRNSWGTAWGESGYFYISYYDKSLEVGAQIINPASATNYSRVYQYDALGWTKSWGYGNTTGWFANMFMASANAKTIKAASIYTPVNNATYSIYVYSNANSIQPWNPRTGTLVRSVTGTIAKAGYHTIPFTAATVTAGKPFSIVVRLTTPGYNWPIPIEYVDAGYSTAGTACPGQSFKSSNGTTWTSCTDTSTGVDFNVCLKAFATP